MEPDLTDVVAPLWSAEHTRQALGLSHHAMTEHRKTRALLAVHTSDGDWFYPVAQFEKHDGKIQVNVALREFMTALPDRDPWTISVLLRTPAPELDNRTPLDWVRHGGDTQTLVTYAEALNAEQGPGSIRLE